MANKFSEECMVCGRELNHLKQATQGTCCYCGNNETSYFICPEGHFVCNKCHANEALMTVSDYCLNTKSNNPLEMLEELMQHSSLAMHGPEHHAMVAAVLVAAYRNVTGELPQESILEAIQRGSKIPGGYCGIYGACGAGIGTGVAVSVITGSTPLKAGPRALSNLMTSEALQQIGRQGGVRCCKACSRIAVQAAVNFCARNLNCEFEVSVKTECKHVARNRQCNGKHCIYFPE